MRSRSGWLAAAVMPVCVCASALAATPPKNVILFVGDGMGAEQVKAAGYYFNGTAGAFSFEQFPSFAWMTHNNSAGGVTDSAASATALATGYKVDNSVISVARASGSDPRSATPSDDRELLTLLETFKAAGKSTGLVTTSYATDATPAAFGAHNVSRSNSADIANDYFTQTRPNVIFGGGASGFSAAAATTAGYTAVTTRAQLQALDTASTAFAAGVFGPGTFGYAYDESIGTSTFYNSNPYLHEMTQSALDLLDNDADGFFLLVENELTDSAGHLALTGASKVERNIFEVRELARAVQKAVDFAAANPDTLILVTGDHETGAYTANANNGAGVWPSVTSGTTNHTASWLPLYAMGPNAGHVRGFLDNTDVPSIATATVPEPAAEARVTKVFRQGLSGYSGAHDTQVRLDSPGTSYGSAATLTVDNDDDPGGVVSPAAPSQVVVRFDDLFGEGAVPVDATIRTARLVIHTGTVSNDGSNGTVEVHRLRVGFDETTTWNSAGLVADNGFGLNGAGDADDDYFAAAESLFPGPRPNTLVSFDVTETLQAWLADQESNFGWILLSNSTDGWRWDSSEAAAALFRPTLEVTYIPEPASAAAVLVGGAWIMRRTRRR